MPDEILPARICGYGVKTSFSTSASGNNKHKICGKLFMQNANPIRFTLHDNTMVIVKKVADNKYDFELILASGSRRTFLWTYGATIDFKDKKGRIDKLLTEAINKFYSVIK